MIFYPLYIYYIYLSTCNLSAIHFVLRVSLLVWCIKNAKRLKRKDRAGEEPPHNVTVNRVILNELL